MLPPAPPKLSGRDFDPSQGLQSNGDDDVNMGEELDEGNVELSSVEINLLIYMYLLESNFQHTAFALLAESHLPQTSIFQYFHPAYPSPSTGGKHPLAKNGLNGTPAQTPGKGVSPTTPAFGRPDGRIERGELVKRLWKSLRWDEVERHVDQSGVPLKKPCPNPFHLLIPHTCPPDFASAVQNPSGPVPSGLRVSPPPRREPSFPSASEAPVAGPSRTARTESNNATPGPSGKRDAADPASKMKRRVRRGSDASSSRASRDPSPARSTSPAKSVREAKREKDKKRARMSDGEGFAERAARSKKAKDDMDVDDEPPSGPKPSRLRNEAASYANSPEANGDDDTVDEMEATPPPPPATESKKRRKDDLAAPAPASGASGGKSPAKAKGKALPADTKPAHPASVKNPLWLTEDRISQWTEHKDAVSSLAWNPANKDVLATGSGDGTARFWDFSGSSEDGMEQSNGHAAASKVVLARNPTVLKHTSIDSSKKSVTAVAWHPNGLALATAAADGIGRLFTPDGQMQGLMTYGRGKLNTVKFCPSGTSMLTAKDDFTVCHWVFGTSYNQTLAKSFEAHTNEVNDVDWLDDHVFASGGNDHVIHVFHVSDKNPHFTFKAHTDDVQRVAWSPAPEKAQSRAQIAETRLLASVSDDGFLMIWRLPSYPSERRTASRSMSPVKGRVKDEDDAFLDSFGSTANAAAAGAKVEGLVRKIRVVDPETENKRMSVLEWSPLAGKEDGRMLVAAGAQESTVKIFDALTGELFHVLPGLEGGTSAIAFSPLGFGFGDMGAIAVAGWQGQLDIWDVATGSKLAEYVCEDERPTARTAAIVQKMAWRSDGQQLAAGLQNRRVMVISVAGLGKGPKKQVEGAEQEKKA